MTAHVDDIIKATGDLVIPILRAIGTITSKEVTCWHKDEGISGKNNMVTVEFQYVLFVLELFIPG